MYIGPKSNPFAPDYFPNRREKKDSSDPEIGNRSLLLFLSPAPVCTYDGIPAPPPELNVSCAPLAAFDPF